MGKRTGWLGLALLGALLTLFVVGTAMGKEHKEKPPEKVVGDIAVLKWGFSNSLSEPKNIYGTVQNIGTEGHTRVLLRWDLLDKSRDKIGQTAESIGNLGAGQRAKFRNYVRADTAFAVLTDVESH